MKVLCTAVIGVCLGLAVAMPAEEEKHYTTKYDNVDVMEVLKSDRSFGAYFDCLMDKGKCTPDGKELKDILPDALETGCKKCSEKQRTEAENAMKYIAEHKPKAWEQLKQKYDPENKYTTKYAKEAKEHGIQL